jgi:membrane protein implicated in regulation of membrane protease activity
MMQNIWIIWLIAGFVLLIFEIFTPGFVVSLIGAACIFTGIVSIIFPNNFIVQFISFSIALILLMIYIRPVFLKYFVRKDSRKSNVDALIGKVCLVDTQIENLKGTGYIKVGADYWKAVSNDGSTIPKGSIVIIDKMEGITATVSLKKD